MSQSYALPCNSVTYPFTVSKGEIIIGKSEKTSTTYISNGSFAVEVVAVGVQPIVKRGDAVYVPIPHGTEYKLFLHNNWNTVADAIVKRDGLFEGRFNIDAKNMTKVERASHTAKNFAYVDENTSDAKEAGVQAKASENGVVEVEFLPERQKVLMGGHGFVEESFYKSKSLSRTKGKRSSVSRDRDQERSSGNGAPAYLSQTFSRDSARGFGSSTQSLGGSNGGMNPLFGQMPANSRTQSLGGSDGINALFGSGTQTLGLSCYNPREVERASMPYLFGGMESTGRTGIEINEIDSASSSSTAPSTFSHGANVFGSASTQKFREVPAVVDIDKERVTKIIFRFVTAKAEPKFESIARAHARAGLPTKQMEVPPRFDEVKKDEESASLAADALAMRGCVSTGRSGIEPMRGYLDADASGHPTELSRTE